MSWRMRRYLGRHCRCCTMPGFWTIRSTGMHTNTAGVHVAESPCLFTDMAHGPSMAVHQLQSGTHLTRGD